MVATGPGRKLGLILPVGPMGMYRWAAYFLKEWKVSCQHVFGYNMDEWSDADGNSLPPDNPGSFQFTMEHVFYDVLGSLTVPAGQRYFDANKLLPAYPERIAELRKGGTAVHLVFGIGRLFHIAFWEPHFTAEFATEEERKWQNYRLGAKLHLLTIEQNAITSFKSRTTLVPARANTIGPGLVLQADRIIGGTDGMLGHGMQWQGMSLWVTLRYGPDRWVPCSYTPTMACRMFFVRKLAGPLLAECN